MKPGFPVLSSIALIKRHIALAGLVGLAIALTLTPLSLYLSLDEIAFTVTAITLNIASTAILSKTYSKLSGSPGALGPVLEAGLAQILSFLVFVAALYNLIPV
jgi:hypothetical protein